jgi:hypothetical protein
VSIVVSSPVGPLWHAESSRPANSAAMIEPLRIVGRRSPMAAFIAHLSLVPGVAGPMPHLRIAWGAMKTKGGGDSHRATLKSVSPEKDEK